VGATPVTQARRLTHPRQLVPHYVALHDAGAEMTAGQLARPHPPKVFLRRGEEGGRGYLSRWNRATAGSFSPGAF
jgi:hypothetical protein